MAQISKKLINKFNDYCTIVDKGIDFDAGQTMYPLFSIYGVSAIEAFYEKETHGKNIATCEPDLLYKALKGKSAFNLQIQMWAEDWCLTKEEFDEIGLPSW